MQIILVGGGVESRNIQDEVEEGCTNERQSDRIAIRLKECGSETDRLGGGR